MKVYMVSVHTSST